MVQVQVYRVYPFASHLRCAVQIGFAVLPRARGTLWQKTPRIQSPCEGRLAPGGQFACKCCYECTPRLV